MDLSVAVIIPVYNAGRFVEKAVASALAFPEVKEVMLVEDGSPDDSLVACQRLVGSDPRIALLRHPDGRNHGAGASRNLGFLRSKSPFVVFLDADDVFLPGRFAKEHEVFAQHPDADGVYGATGSVYHDQVGRERFLQLCPEDEFATVRKVVPPERLFSGLLGNIKGFGYFCMAALTVRRSAVERLGVPFDPALRLHQDSLFMLQLAHGARLYAGEVKEAIVMRGVHASNRITSNKDRAGSNYLLHSRLEKWARGVALCRDDRRLVIAKRIYWQVLCCGSQVTRLWMFRYFIAYPWLFRWVQVREAWIDAVFRKGSRLAQMVRSLTWRMGGNVRTTVA